ncbi:HYR domain-containing protein, partial [Mariniphaga sediminis]|uniref:HYR domain-containing protein n=1 Tax=Mariniphaga sediminis TaxID=1628158 RepID=UPI0035621D66
MDTSYAYPADFQKQFTIHFPDKRLTSFQYISDLRPGKNLVPVWRDACLDFSGDGSINHNCCYVAPLNLLPVYFNIKKQTGVHHSNAPPLVFFAEKKEYQPFKSKNYCQSPADSCILIQEPFLASAIETTLPARLVRPDGADFLWQQIDYDFNRQLLITAAGQGPVLDCPEDISTYTDINTCTSFIAGNLNPGFDENSVITLTWEMTGATNDASPPQGINLIDDYTFSEGVTVVTYTATGTDGSTTSCFFTITISDNQVPRIESMPSDITVVANPGECTAVVYWSEPIVSDNCTPSNQIIKESTVDPGEVFSVGSTHVLYRAFDAMGNESAVQSFTVTVEDKEPPVLVLPGNLTIHCGDVIPAPWQTWQQLTAAGGNAADNCALDESTFSLRSETASAENCPYVLTRTYEVADAHGNIATAQHRITVEGEEQGPEEGEVWLKSGMADISAAQSGNWSDPNTWGGSVPTISDNVTIPNGITVTVDVAAFCADILIETGGTVNYGGGYNLQVNGNWTNNGTYNGGTSGIVEFAGSLAATISGITTFEELIISKGNLSATLNIGGNVTVGSGGSLTLNGGLVTINSGGSFTIDPSSGITIPSTAGFDVAGGTLTTGDFTITNEGLIRITSGTANFGTDSGNAVNNQVDGAFIVSNGTVNISGRLHNSASGTLTPPGVSSGIHISGGTVTLATVGNGLSSVGSLNVTAAGTFDFSGGTIVFQNPSDATTELDLGLTSGTGIKNTVGGTFQFGNGSTPAGSVFDISSNILLNNVTSHANADLSLSGDLLVNQLSLNSSSQIDLNGNALQLAVAGTGTYNFPLDDGN